MLRPEPPDASVSMDESRLIWVVLAAAIGGAINSIAGGGTLVTFPALVGLGVPAIVANATRSSANRSGCSQFGAWPASA